MMTGTSRRLAARKVRMARKKASNRSGETRFRCGNEPVFIFCSGVRKSACSGRVRVSIAV